MNIQHQFHFSRTCDNTADQLRERVSAFTTNIGFCPGLLLEPTRKQGEVRRADVVTLLHISAPKAYRLLRRLQEEGKLALHGKGAGAYDTMREEK